MEKYLRHYAEPEVLALHTFPDLPPWANVIVIPACNESTELLRPLPPAEGRSLMILVINESESASSDVSSNNRTLADDVKQRFELLWHIGAAQEGFRLYLFRDPQGPREILLVDRFSEGCKLPVKGGVGQARKIGADLATGLFHCKKIISPWIHCTDGDVRLPDTYLACSNGLQASPKSYAALVYPYHHCEGHGGGVEKDVVLATQLYELSLRYYVAGMKFANSPYAFHTIGSTMAVHAKHYARVRGFPKRAAGEDFYLLNKLAKTGAILELAASPQCKPIQIEARRSDRVPFGTGAAVNKITTLATPVADYQFYNPAVFELLKLWLQALPAIWQSRSGELSIDQLLVQIDGLEKDVLIEALLAIGTQKALGHAFKQSKDLHQFTRQLNTWFDAFRTLKLIHFLRDNALPSISYAMLEENRTFKKLLKQDSGLLDYYQYYQSLPGY
jgi:hypothetical protein